MRRWLVQAHPVWWSLIGTENAHLMNAEDTYVTVARRWTRAGAENLRLRLTGDALARGSTVRFAVRRADAARLARGEGS